MKRLLSILFLCCMLTSTQFLFGQSDKIAFLDAFETDKLNKVEVHFDNYDWRRSVYTTNELVEAEVTINDDVYVHVKIGRKGNSSNFNTMGRDKIPFKVDGPKSFNFKLNNNYRDYSMGAREYIAYRMHREFTGIGSNVAPAEVYIDKEFYGLYLVIEDITRTFYESHVGGVDERIKANPPEDFAEGTFYSDLFWYGDKMEYYTSRYEVKIGVLESLVDLIDIINNKPEEAHKYIDIDQVCRFLAVDNYMLNTAGIIGEVYSHNYELVKRKSDGKWQLVPWDLNLCLGAWSQPELVNEENVVDMVTQLQPVYGAENNGLIALVIENYPFLYHSYYAKLIEKYNDKVLIGWANEYLDILRQSSEIDDKLYDDEFFEKAYTSNLSTIDGLVTALLPTIQSRYNYVKNLELGSKFYNRIKGIELKGNSVFVKIHDDIKNEAVIIEYLDSNNEYKRVRTSKAKISGTRVGTLPSDAQAYYAYVYYQGVKYSYPVKGELDMIPLIAH